jgi:predicted nucleic acid-binding Zn ribbon protein
MDRQGLAALEQAIEPYRRKGFVITSQSEGAFTLSPPIKKFNYFLFLITLLLFWPVAVLYLINFDSQKGKSVCIRITSQGEIEESGYTLEIIEKSRKRQLMTNLFIILSTAALMVFILWLLGYL